MSKRKSKWIKRTFLFVIAFLILSSGYHAFASANDLKTYPAQGQLVDVGGYRLHIVCVGEGSPTVVMEAGMSGWSVDWYFVQPEIGRFTRVCAYDRAGYGWSDAGPQPRDSRQVAKELHTLLSNAGIEGEIVLVGHSLGGLFAQYYARTNPDQVAGLVLVDSVHYEQSVRMRADVRNRYEYGLRGLTLATKIFAPTGLLRLSNQPETIITRKLPDEIQPMVLALGLQSKAYSALDGEMASFQQSQLEVREAEPLPSIPLAVISSTTLQDFPPGFSGEYMQGLWSELQADLSKSATVPQVIAETSGHYIHLDQPELVIQAIVEIVNIVREK
ncbi:MAG: alpha/beta hydrolase [Anaerolineales bacterium]|nr:alpha/beta hydrolase [Anaerolineales bacterium]